MPNGRRAMYSIRTGISAPCADSRTSAESLPIHSYEAMSNRAALMPVADGRKLGFP